MGSVKKKAPAPPDLVRCQAEKPNGHSFMTLGGSPGFERCASKPTVILTENTPGRDGHKGSMALCDACLAQFRKQMPADFATIEPIPVSKWAQVSCDLCDSPIAYRHPEGGLRCTTCPRPET